MQPLVSPQSTPPLELRNYQETLIADARAAMRAGYRRPLLCLPTGGGKTIVAGRIIAGAIERGKRVVFLAHRKELIDQASKKLDALGIDHGIIMANHWRRKPHALVQVASIATLVNRELHSAPDLIFIDECIAGDAMVETREGLFRMDDPSLAGREVLAFHEPTGRWVYSKILRWIDRGRKQTLIVATENGAIECTKDHLFLTERGWVKAGELRQGDRVLSPSRECSPERSAASSPVRSWVTRPSCTPTSEAVSPGLMGCMDQSRKSGQSTRPRDLESSTSVCGLRSTADTEPPALDCARPVIQTYAPFIGSLFGTEGRRSVTNGSMFLQRKGLRGGTWMMDLWATVRTLRASTSTLKDSAKRKINYFQRFWRKDLGSAAKYATQGADTISDSTPDHHAAGLKCLPNTASHRWHTNFVEVRRVQPGRFRRVFDLEVQGEHNFVANGLLVHNCHRARAASYQAILENYPAAFAIGLTATPIRSDGKGLGNLFDTLIQGPSVASLTEQGYLVPTRVYAPAKPDTSGVKVTAGDYNQQGLQRIMDKPMLTGDIVSHWQRLGENRQTVCFAAGIEHSRHIVEQFRAVGIAAEHVDGTTDKDERERILSDIEAGLVRVVSNYGVLTEGWDCPPVGCAIIARPTKNEGLYLQMAGRILRPAPGKVDALILDHAGCTLEHGLVDENRHWTLDRDRTRVGGPKINLRLPRVCPDCFRVCGLSDTTCPCGYVFSSRNGSGPVQVDGDLQEVIEGRGRRDFSRIPMERRREMYMRWVSEAVEKGWKPSAPWAKYYAMFKTPPEAEWMLEASAEMRPIIAARDRKAGELIPA